ncbi:MAG: tRNA-dihydrouridine synthase [Candidatus Falkowbacteria bacterium]|nr:tRNA-dihydrouridine synthase [Candidatus Falkowbacteria bacterium]
MKSNNLMSKNFWKELRRPILALAPLAGFTDSAYRQLCARYSAQVLYSEMVSATALFYDSKESLELIKFNRRLEKNYVVQLFGSNPAHFAKAVRIITQKVRPAGIDLNCGCPVKKVLQQGAGAALMKDIKRTREIIKVILANTDLPLSIKLRAGNGQMDASKFLKELSDLDIKAVMIHGRTLAGGFSGEVDLELIKNVRPYFKGVILANGGINTPADIKRVLKTTGADGVGIARGALGNPWIFSLKERPKNKSEIFKVILDNAKLVKKLKGEAGLIELRKHLVWYVNGLAGASHLRAELVKVKTLKDLKNILNNSLNNK